MLQRYLQAETCVPALTAAVEAGLNVLGEALKIATPSLQVWVAISRLACIVPAERSTTQRLRFVEVDGAGVSPALHQLMCYFIRVTKFHDLNVLT